MKEYIFEKHNKLEVHKKLLVKAKSDKSWNIQEESVTKVVLGWLSGSSKAFELIFNLSNWKNNKNSTSMKIQEKKWLFFLPYVFIFMIIALLGVAGYFLGIPLDSDLYVIFMTLELMLSAWCVLQYWFARKKVDGFLESFYEELVEDESIKKKTRGKRR